MIQNAMVLAAGFGTRMRHLTQHKPKPLIEVAGRTMMDRALDHLVVAGVTDAVVNLHHFGGMIREHLDGRDDIRVRFSVEEPDILETGGGIVQALPLLGPEPFFAMNSDAIWSRPNPMLPMLNAWDPARMDALLLCVPKERARGYTRAGDFFLEGPGQTIRRRGEGPSAPFVYTGVQIIKPECFAGLKAEKFSLNVVWNRLIADGSGIHGCIYDGDWCDVGTPEGIGEAEEALTALAA
ncbi:MAG TPA: nucleotidyltransferase family protein [Thermohalobaculum sp.]|nr:nucleotidyltransferase family protein [Thermohalobaculum sp.]